MIYLGDKKVSSYLGRNYLGRNYLGEDLIGSMGKKDEEETPEEDLGNSTFGYGWNETQAGYGHMFIIETSDAMRTSGIGGNVRKVISNLALKHSIGSALVGTNQRWHYIFLSHSTRKGEFIINSPGELYNHIINGKELVTLHNATSINITLTKILNFADLTLGDRFLTQSLNGIFTPEGAWPWPQGKGGVDTGDFPAGISYKYINHQILNLKSITYVGVSISSGLGSDSAKQRMIEIANTFANRNVKISIVTNASVIPRVIDLVDITGGKISDDIGGEFENFVLDYI